MTAPGARQLDRANTRPIRNRCAEFCRQNTRRAVPAFRSDLHTAPKSSASCLEVGLFLIRRNGGINDTLGRFAWLRRDLRVSIGFALNDEAVGVVPEPIEGGGGEQPIGRKGVGAVRLFFDTFRHVG